jgi:hypothetical protein
MVAVRLPPMQAAWGFFLFSVVGAFYKLNLIRSVIFGFIYQF